MKRIKISLLVLFLLLSTSNVYSAWEGPVDVVVGTWGTNTGQFGISYQDTADLFPQSFGVSNSGKIVIADSINEVLHIFNNDGSFLRDIRKPVTRKRWPYDVDVNDECAVVGYVDFTHTFNITTGELIGTANNMGGAKYVSDDCSKIYVDVGTTQVTWKVYSPTGNLIRTTTERPLELGKVKEKKTAAGYTYTVQYPDITNPNTVKTYTINLPGPYERFVRDNTGNIYTIAGKAVRKFDGEGREIGVMRTPANEIRTIRPAGGGFEAETEVIAQYGEPVVAPTGDVYTWKRTPTAYSIIKWTWR